MKKITTPIVLAFLVLGFGALGQANNQSKIKIGKFNEEYNGEEKSNTKTKVTENFSKMFSDATNIKWTSDGRVERVYFEGKGKATRAAFNKKGQFLYSVTTYKEELLPQDVLLMVKQTYYGKGIFGVTEVNALGKTAYLIILEDKTSWLHIKVLDGEMTEEKVLLKAN